MIWWWWWCYGIWVDKNLAWCSTWRNGPSSNSQWLSSGLHRLAQTLHSCMDSKHERNIEEYCRVKFSALLIPNEKESRCIQCSVCTFDRRTHLMKVALSLLAELFTSPGGQHTAFLFYNAEGRAWSKAPRGCLFVRMFVLLCLFVLLCSLFVPVFETSGLYLIQSSQRLFVCLVVCSSLFVCLSVWN